MKLAIRIVWILLVIASVGASTGKAQTPPVAEAKLAAWCGDAVVEDPSISSGTIAFATRLAELGPRPAAGNGELRARTAVVAELETIGLEVAIEPFDYQTFRVEKTVLDLGGASADPVVVGLDPFVNRLAFAGEAVVVTDPAQGSEGLKGRIVVTNHPLMQLLISEFEPAVVIAVEPGDLEAFVGRGNLEVSLDVEGTPLVLRSANVVARYEQRNPSGPEILVTSHLDAYQVSPGANDNGTGLGLMIELARAFAKYAEQLDVSITFAAFGAEENGAIGSRAYVQDHVAGLERVVAVVNLDTLGGALGPVIATEASEEAVFSEKPGIHVPEDLRDRAWEGPEGRWRIIHPEIIPAAFTSNYPEWLHRVVTQSATDLGIEIVHLNLISDHRTFALAGVPAISIQSKEHHIHSKEDTADVLVAETIASGARLAARILCELQGRPNQPSQ
jgi:Iap family predicted aminopeptidase